MTTTADLIARIREKGANIVLGNDGLRVINRDRLSPEAIAYIKKHRLALAEHLSADADIEERSAIIEHDGGLPRVAADGLARLLFATVPAGVDPADWSWFVGHAAKIFDDTCGGAAR